MAYVLEKSKKKTSGLRIPLKQKVLSTQTEFYLLTQQWNQFCEALEQPPRIIPVLKSLLTESTLLDG